MQCLHLYSPYITLMTEQPLYISYPWDSMKEAIVEGDHYGEVMQIHSKTALEILKTGCYREVAVVER